MQRCHHKAGACFEITSGREQNTRLMIDSDCIRVLARMKVSRKEKRRMNQPKQRPLSAASAAEAPANSPPLPAIVAGAFDRLNIRLRARMLGRLLASVGPLALAVVGGGVFSKYVAQARWPEIPVSFDDAARTTSEQVYELVRYVQQSNPEMLGHLMNLLTRDTVTISALGTSVAALAIQSLSRRQGNDSRPSGV